VSGVSSGCGDSSRVTSLGASPYRKDDGRLYINSGGEIIRDLVNKDNKILYAVPYQHFTNAIEHYFSILKSKLQKLEGLTFNELKLNIRKVIKEIPKETYKNLLIGSYKRDGVYVKKPSRKSSKKLKKYK